MLHVRLEAHLVQPPPLNPEPEADLRGEAQRLRRGPGQLLRPRRLVNRLLRVPLNGEATSRRISVVKLSKAMLVRNRRVNRRRQDLGDGEGIRQ